MVSMCPWEPVYAHTVYMRSYKLLHKALTECKLSVSSMHARSLEPGHSYQNMGWTTCLASQAAPCATLATASNKVA